VRFALFSCAEFTHGSYNAYEPLASEDVDFVVELGDSIYRVQRGQRSIKGRQRAGVSGDRIGP
jgi:alkaline phosphatase D